MYNSKTFNKLKVKDKRTVIKNLIENNLLDIKLLKNNQINILIKDDDNLSIFDMIVKNLSNKDVIKILKELIDEDYLNELNLFKYIINDFENSVNLNKYLDILENISIDTKFGEYILFNEIDVDFSKIEDYILKKTIDLIFIEKEKVIKKTKKVFYYDDYIIKEVFNAHDYEYDIDGINTYDNTDILFKNIINSKSLLFNYLKDNIYNINATIKIYLDNTIKGYQLFFDKKYKISKNSKIDINLDKFFKYCHNNYITDEHVENVLSQLIKKECVDDLYNLKYNFNKLFSYNSFKNKSIYKIFVLELIKNNLLSFNREITVSTTLRKHILEYNNSNIKKLSYYILSSFNDDLTLPKTLNKKSFKFDAYIILNRVFNFLKKEINSIEDDKLRYSLFLMYKKVYKNFNNQLKDLDINREIEEKMDDILNIISIMNKDQLKAVEKVINYKKQQDRDISEDIDIN